jgi:hypothetical protein
MPTAPSSVTHLSDLKVGPVMNQQTGSYTFLNGVPVILNFSTAPKAAAATTYLNAQSLNGSTQTINIKPDYPRNITMAASGSTTANVTINGLDYQGYAISETLALNNTSTVTGKKAYSEILTIVLPTVSTTTINVGIGVLFGLPQQSTQASVFLALVDAAADSGLGTFAVGGTTAGTDYYGTWTPATAPNGTHKYWMAYIPTSVVLYGVNN